MNSRSGPEISVVVPTRFRPELVVRAVESLLSQTLSPKEVIVVVDGPDDSTVSALESIKDDRLKVNVLPQNLGGAGTRNAGVAMATGEWVAFLDDDDRWLPEKLEHQVAFILEQAPEGNFFSLTGAIGRKVDEDTNWPKRLPQKGESVSEYLFCHKKVFVGGESMLATSALLAPRSLLVETGFDPALRFHQDWDLFLRLDSQGVPLLFAPYNDLIMDADDARSSISTKITWKDSLGWAKQRRSYFKGSSFSGFCSTFIALKAYGSLSGSLATMQGVLTGKPTPVDVVRTLAQLIVPISVRDWVWKLRGRSASA